jgi:hypothetical protein
MNIGNHERHHVEPGRVVFLVTCAALLLAGSPRLAAQTTDLDRFSVSLGVFFTSRDTITRLDGDVPGSGEDVDLENDFGFDASDAVFRIDGYFRFNEKHRLDLSAFDLSRSASKRIQKDIEWDGSTYPIDTVIDAGLDLTIYKLAYTWSFMRREKGYLGASAGLYVADIGTSLAAAAIGQSSNRSTTAPLPVIGLRGQYDFSDKWSLRGSAELFAFEYGDFDGSLYDVYAGLDYQLFEHMAIGVGVNSVDFNVGVTKTNFNGDLDWRYTGGLLFFKFDF